MIHLNWLNFRKPGSVRGPWGLCIRLLLDSGSIITLRKIKEGLVGSDDLEAWITFFGGLNDVWLSKMHLGFWYGGEVFIVHEYFCLGSLEQLLHGCEGTQFTPLSWGVRLRIAFCAAKAVASLHKQVTRKGSNLVCGVIKSSNILIQLSFSACLSGYETPYLIPPSTIVRRNPGRVAPELTTTQNSPKVFTRKSDVYSFGILLLEIVTGKKPTVTDLGECVKEKRKREGLKGVCDKKWFIAHFVCIPCNLLDGISNPLSNHSVKFKFAEKEPWKIGGGGDEYSAPKFGGRAMSWKTGGGGEKTGAGGGGDRTGGGGGVIGTGGGGENTGGGGEKTSGGGGK
ncbi:leucine-rich repeat (LRR) family protein [Actinidia rufa]|uniref:Leucine-rich repeat (LRR) family protein n=1 Tax=Actinidia rufa TaxID=165716 RepID=A0A7J0F9F1_9ERIC|nr:leucine-rich repeat (LRR) family protein [Actinidia rufa]